MTNPEPRERTGLPRWVRLTLIIGVLVAALVIVLMFTLGGGHHIPRHG